MPSPTIPFLLSCGVRPGVAAEVSPHLIDACAKFAILSREQLAGFIGQCMHESAMFTHRVESMTYSAERLMVVWPHRFPTHDIADKYALDGRKLANLVYANRNGNGPPESDDGWNYRGSGYLQITGKNNFQVARVATGNNYIVSPDLIRNEAKHAALAAACFWFSNGLNTLITAAGIDAVTHKINPYDDAKASENRRHLYARAYSASQIA